LNRHLITNPTTGETINHPANLLVALGGLAQVRNIPVSEMADIVEANATRWLGLAVTDGK
jgi:Tat protein secretion system quality control protein TatD with DNase activity